MHIDWFPETLIALPGRMGLTHIPGADNELDRDLDSLQSQGMNRLLCLVEPHEMAYLNPPQTIAQRRESVEQRDSAFLHHPIVDFEAPILAEAKSTIQTIDKALNEGEVVVAHCWAGLGRAGTMAACLLVHRGMGAQNAMHAVRSVRNGAIQSNVQELFIVAFAEATQLRPG